MSKVYLRIVRQYGTTVAPNQTLLDALVILGGDGGKTGTTTGFSLPTAIAEWNTIPTPSPGYMGFPLHVFSGTGVSQPFSLVGAYAKIIASSLAQSSSVPPQFFDATGPVLTNGASYGSVADTAFPRRYAIGGWYKGTDGVTQYSIFKTANDFPAEAYAQEGGSFGQLLATGTGAYAQQWKIPGVCITSKPMLQVGLGLVTPWGAGQPTSVVGGPVSWRAMTDITYVIELPDALFSSEQTAITDYYIAIAQKGSAAILLPGSTALAGVAKNNTSTDADANAFYLSIAALKNPALLDPSTRCLTIPTSTHAAVAATKGYIWDQDGVKRFPVASSTSIIAGMSPIVNDIPVSILSTDDMPLVVAY
jgi:hypothetical protein